MQHLDEGTLHAFLDRARSDMGPEQAEKIDRHLAECGECAALVAKARDLTLRARSILSSAGPRDLTVPEYRSVLLRARGTPTERASRRRWIVGAWAASIALALGVGWVMNDATRPARVALVRPELATQAPVAAPARQEPGETGSGVQESSEPLGDALADPSPTLEDPQVASGSAGADGSVPVRSPSSDAAPARVGVGTPVTTTLRGRVTDENGEPLPAVQISVPGTALGTLTNAQGDFSLRLGAADSVGGPVTVTAERLGFSPATVELADLGADTVLAEFRLEPTNLALQGIVATGLVDPVSDSRVGRAEVVGAPTATLRAPSPAETWSETTRTDAEGRAGFELLLVPELEVLHIEVGESRGAVVVRIQQALATEGVLTLLERRIVSDPDTNAVGVDGSETLSMRRGDVMITASGPLAADSLRALLEQVR